MNLIDQQRWQAVQTKETTGTPFIYAVKTTGVACRVGCASRLPKPENVLFYADLKSALVDGFRPCKRCQPQLSPDVMMPSEDLEQIILACERLSEVQAPSLTELAYEIGLSPGHFQRKFKAILGISPKHYAKTLQSQRFKHALTHADSITAAVYAAGLSSTSRAYALVQQRLGMSPSTWKAGGKGELLIYAQTQTELGLLGLICSPRGICGVELADKIEQVAAQFKARFPHAQIESAEVELESLLAQLIAQIERPQAVQSLPLDIQGTAFQEQVWQALLQIPAGQTRSYAEIAHQIGKPKAVRAVASACAANRHAIVIPCHRIVRKSGQLSGYRWGIARKRQLLAREMPDPAFGSL